MAHFAELGNNNTVLRIVIVDNDMIMRGDEESDEKGINYLQRLFGENTVWKQTSYNNNFRGRYAAKGFIYNEDKDVFHPPKLHPSWVYNDELNEYEAPVPYPDDGEYYLWNEENQEWDLIE